MPKFFWPRMTKPTMRDADHRERNGDPEPALAHEIDLLRRMIRCSIVMRLIQPASMRPAENSARDDHRGEDRGDDADGQRDRKAFHRPGGLARRGSRR